MYEPPPTLPPQLGKWLASSDPMLHVKAEAALRDAEPDTHDLLVERIKSERNRIIYAYFGCQAAAQMIFQISKRGHIEGFADFCTAFAVMLPSFLLMAYLFLLPIVKQCDALIFALAGRGDVRAVPFLILTGQIRRTKKNANAKVEDALLSLVQTAVPGSVPFSQDPNAKDPAVPLRAKFGPLTQERGGTVFFHEKATATPLRVQLWLALLPHLAADPNPKSRAVLRCIADARAQTLDEELIQNAARNLLDENAASSRAKPEAVTVLQTEAWKPAVMGETPAPVQRLHRS